MLYFMFFKMIQTVNETMHHSKDLDTAYLLAEIKNITRPSQTSRRLFFNKEILSLGFLQVQLFDQIKISFLIKRPDKDEPEPF